MNSTKKILAFILAAVMVVSLTSCTKTVSLGTTTEKAWCYKNDDLTLPIGVYLNYLYAGYSESSNAVKEGLDSDSNVTKFGSMEYKDSDGNKTTVEEYAKKIAKQSSLEYLLFWNKLKELKGDKAPTQQEVNTYIEDYKKQTEEMYQAYGYSYSFDNVYSSIAGYGISSKSYDLCIGADYLYEALFRAIYDTDGDTPVKDDELKSYFIDKFTHYRYIKVDYKKTITVKDGTDSDAKDKTTDTDMDGDEKKEKKDYMTKFATSVNSVKDLEEATIKYMKANDLSYDPTISHTDIIDEDNTEEIIYKALKDLGTNKAVYVEDEKQTCGYLIFKGDIKDYVDFFEVKNDSTKDENKTSDTDTSSDKEESTDKETTSDTDDKKDDKKEPTVNKVTSGFTRFSLLMKMKQDEFEKYLEDEVSKLKYETNEAEISKYSVSIFE